MVPPGPVIFVILFSTCLSRDLADSNRGLRGCNPVPSLSAKISWTRRELHPRRTAYKTAALTPELRVGGPPRT